MSRRSSRQVRTLAVAGLAAAAVALAGCGKKGPPEPPEGSTYPRVYPQPSSVIYEGDLLKPTHTIQDRGGLRDNVEGYPSDTDFPDRNRFDEDEEAEVFPQDDPFASESGGDEQ